MSDITLRDVIESDLPILFEQQLDPEATEMADFPSRGRRCIYGALGQGFGQIQQYHQNHPGRRAGGWEHWEL